MHLRLNRYYRFGWLNQRTLQVGNSYENYLTTPRDIEIKLNHFRQIQRDYPRHTFWIEESNDGENWAKLNENSKYALFSED